jgi:tetratricopeptide (TPR) repeat protein
LIYLASSLRQDKQLDAAEEAAFHAINILPEKGEKLYRVCESHRTLGNIYQSKGETEKAINHYELSIRIASSFSWHDELFWTHYKLAGLFRDQGRFNDANNHLELAKSHAVGSTHNLGCAMEGQALVWYKQHRLEEAKSEALRAADIFNKLGAAKGMKACRKLLQWIEEELTAQLPLVNRNSIVSSCKWRYFLRVLTLRSKLRELNESVDGRIKFFEFIRMRASITPHSIYRAVFQHDYHCYPSLY